MTLQSRTLHPATAAARIAPLLLQLAALAIADGGLWLWRHRQQIGEALVTAAATTYAAGAWCRQQIEALATDSARLLPTQPVPALAPITASLAAAWGLVDRGTMARGHRAQRARMADIASAIIASAYGCSVIEPWQLQAVVRVNGMNVRTYEFGYTISAKGETRECVLKVIGEADHDRYVAAAKDENWNEANSPNIKGVSRQSPSPTQYWVRLASREQAPNA
jgi:hypothetical protein